MGTYLRVMSMLGISGELALLTGETLLPRRPILRRPGRDVRRRWCRSMSASDETRHRLQDLQSLALHEEAVRLGQSDPALVQAAQETVQRWLASGDVRSASLWREWQDILRAGAWRKVLGRSRHAQQLRQASPLVTILPDERAPAHPRGGGP